ncbi:MAG: four helix bundle protein [Bacteroidetes bacterium]|nr:four helix bundle protein [Bacteroidota bacterium]
MNPDLLKARTKKFAIACLAICKRIPPVPENNVLKIQLSKSGTSVGANYRAACRARSQNEFIAKLSIVNEEADESCYWLEVITEGEVLADAETFKLLKEANELNAIFTASAKTAKMNRWLKQQGDKESDS